MVIEGVDYSTARPDPKGLVAAGKKFAVRYGGPGSAGKHLTAGELKALRAVGIDVVANAEGSSGGYRGDAAGQNWARQAEHDFRALGMGADRPIYFSADWDVQPNEMASVDAALRGSAKIIAASRVGIYGSYDVIDHCYRTGTAKWLWQAAAWSTWTNPATGKREVRWHPKAHLQQYHNSVALAGGEVDLTRALTIDYGQWNFKGDDFEMTDAEMDKFAAKIAAAVAPAVAAALLKSDTVPVTPANGVSTTWMTQTALGDMTTKLGEISRNIAQVVRNTTPPAPPTA
jgi:hypothetical protein